MTFMLRSRLTLLYTVLFGVLLAVIAAVSYHVLAYQLDADVSANLTELTTGLHGYLRFPDDRPTVIFDQADPAQAAFVEEAATPGDIVVLAGDFESSKDGAGDWPGREAGLSPREAEVIALITQGRSNADIASLMYLSINTVKTYIRSAYRKIGVTGRSHALLWGLDHGFQPDHHRIDHWRGGP